MSKIDVELIAEDNNKRSKFIYDFLQKKAQPQICENVIIPKVIVQYWHSFDELPNDVFKCIESWKILKKKGFEFELFDDNLAKKFIIKHLSEEYLISYLKCHHPAMRCDYFRLCYLYIYGGFYVDSDEFYLNQKIDSLFNDNNIKIQPLCYNMEQEKMIELKYYLNKLYNKANIYYFNNNPIVTPPLHELIYIALRRATHKLLKEENIFDIQSTTGPGNLSASIIYYLLSGKDKINIIDNWNSISKSPWNLSYRKDNRNWRLYNGNNKKWFD